MFPKSKLICRINVFGKKVSIHLGGEVPDKVRDLAGLYMPKENQIWINSNQDQNEKLETLIHEVFEAVWDRCSLTQTSLNEAAKDILIDVFSKAVKELFLEQKIHKFLEKKSV